MKKLLRLKFLILFASLLTVSSYFILKQNNVENIYRITLRNFIKNNFVKYVTPFLFEKEINKKESLTDTTLKKKTVELSNNKILKKYKLTSGFYTGISKLFAGSGYIDFEKNNLFVLSSRGLLAFNSNLDNNNFKQIKNNIDDYIGLKQFEKSYKFSIKDLLINNGKIYVSYTEEIKEDCWNTSLLYADVNYKKIKFERLFSPKECVHSSRNLDQEFEARQSGGRIFPMSDNQILLTIGDYRARHLAQNKESINGKVLLINNVDKTYKIISMGHRNPQGLFFDKQNNFILETEHGPQGGDEINLIEVSKIKKGTIQNYGWPIASAGEHYGGKVDKNLDKYKKYPLHKSHLNYGFIEPLKSFVPSIGISEIVKLKQNKYVVSSLKANKLYFFELDKNKMIKNLNEFAVNERIRDLKYKNNILYMFMENSASIGTIVLNNK
ncbi:MAG: PQQ-dependent sugar dehydrogenase [Prochlorococcus marinus CUG1431]|uniref:PQQ-dependent sugar dehydrogenase n=1 Tax=Prochlorococcus marinus CUG1433 TaxID=2774506 RepID=A0A9D9G3Q6_PROMR|nr:PQQ-dependent sugar dehydrogenase [Prochlorococcus marinus CUG1433]MBO6981172.1 PQQ-dependent sugar dehydrogenase [Prochlorococcus marinus CUG1431]